MARPHTSPNSFKHSRYRRGRVYIAGNTLYVEMPPRGEHRNPIRVSTYLYAKTQRGKIIQENLNAALEILKLANWLYDNIELPANTPYRDLLRVFGAEAMPAASDDSPVLIEYAWDEFAKIRFANIVDGSVDNWTRAKRCYLPKTTDSGIPKTLPKTRADVEGMAKYILHRRQKRNLAPSTAIGYELRIEAFFDFCISREWLRGNPFKYIPSIQNKKADIRAFTVDDVISIDKFWGNRVDTAPTPRTKLPNKSLAYKNTMMRLLVRFIFITGARVQEALRMRREWFTDECIKIGWVKGASSGKASRQIPHGIMPGSRDVVADILYATKEVDGRVFPWRTAHDAGVYFEAAAKELSLPPRKRFHAIRKTTGNYWRDVLRVPEQMYAEMMGHTVEVSRGVYMEPPTLKTYLALTDKTPIVPPQPIFSRLFVEV